MGERALVVEDSEDDFAWTGLGSGPNEPPNIAFLADNRLTEETAFGLLHLFHHLRDAAFTEVYASHCRPNPRLLELLPGRGGGGGVSSSSRARSSQSATQ